jgi:hypothetical protein
MKVENFHVVEADWYAKRGSFSDQELFGFNVFENFAISSLSTILFKILV